MVAATRLAGALTPPPSGDVSRGYELWSLLLVDGKAAGGNVLLSGLPTVEYAVAEARSSGPGSYMVCDGAGNVARLKVRPNRRVRVKPQRRGVYL